MGKIKVGDRVRAIHSSGLGLFLAGQEYEVLDVRDEKITAINERRQRDSWGADHFELIPVAAQTFKVGDRVRLTANEGEGRDSGAIGVIEKITNNYARVLFDAPFNGWGETGRNWHAQLSRLLAASFKIEAGKYYRTRDGRKVGPMEAWRFGGWHSDRAEHPLNGGVWLDGGTAKYAGAKDSPDLIAEWVDEPVKAAAPVAVQQDAPELTVKLSFDAAEVTNAIKSTLLKTNQGYGFEIARHGDYVWVDTGKKAPIVLKATDVQAAA